MVLVTSLGSHRTGKDLFLAVQGLQVGERWAPETGPPDSFMASARMYCWSLPRQALF